MPIRGMYLPIRGAYMPIRGEGVSSALTMMASVPLPGAKAEGEALGKLLTNPTVLTDKQATKATLLEAGGKCDLLHIATHGYADPEYPEFSGLLLAGEGETPYDTLTAQEVYLWSLKARLVTLSACQTAMGKTVEGEGMMGLTRAFIYAGAQDVLCTLWPVADESTKALMTAFYENLKKDQPIEEALRNAQSTLADAKATSHPFFWAGFIAVRGPE
jgi:CHAT domain-containing protein